MGNPKPSAPLSRTIDASALAQTVESLDVKAQATTLPTTTSEALTSARSVPHTSNEQEAKPEETSSQPTRIGRYILLKQLGEGAMGVVYAAYDEELDRKVAVKILHPSSQSDDQLRNRILREAQALARVSSPNVVHAYQVGEMGSQIFVAMEFVNGTTLSKWQAEAGRSWQEILRMYIAAGQGLRDAHQAGLIHRDFKPDNVLIGKDGWPRVADFGLARIEAKSKTDIHTDDSSIGAVVSANPMKLPLRALTQAGVVMGTPLYMPPEQHLGESTDSRSDQFSFCVALYEALYRQMPFSGDTLESLRFSVISGKILNRPADSHVPNVVHEAILRGLSTAPAHRFPSMSDLLTALTFDPSKDAAIGPYARRKVILSMIALTIIAGLGVKVLEWRGVGAQLSSLATTMGLFAVLINMTIRFRKVIRKNGFHRGLLAYGLIVAAWMLSLRGVGFLLDLKISQMMTLDLLAMAAMSSITAVMVLPSLWPLIPVMCISVVISALKPELAETIAFIALPLAYVTSTILWYRATMARSQRRKSINTNATT